MSFLSNLFSSEEYDYTIDYSLACRKCRYMHPNSIDFIYNSKEKLSSANREQLITALDNFNHVHCNVCGSNDDWLVFKVEISYDRVIVKQMIMTISQKGTQIDSHVDGGYEILNREEWQKVFVEIENKLEHIYEIDNTINYKTQPIPNKIGITTIVIDFLNISPFIRLSLMDIDNMGYLPIKGLIKNLKSYLKIDN